MDIYESLRDAIRAEDPVALVTEIDGPHPGAKRLVRPGAEPLGTLGDAELDRIATRDALGELEAGTTGTRHYGPRGEARMTEVTLFVESFAPPPRMIILGAVDFTAALVRVGKTLGYRVTVCDARPVFATRQRFPQADEVVVDWPDRYLETVGERLGPRDAVCVLTHDPKFDVPAILVSLRTRVGYIGAMGSRRTHATRVERLRESGVTDDALSRIMAPIGLDIGSRTPEETAISICAEIISLRTAGRSARGGSGARQRPPGPLSLKDREGPIHRR